MTFEHIQRNRFAIAILQHEARLERTIYRRFDRCCHGKPRNDEPSRRERTLAINQTMLKMAANSTYGRIA